MNNGNIYYTLKPIIPRCIQILLRRKRAQNILSKCADIWPIDHRITVSDLNWQGWPDHKAFCFAISHDVEDYRGLKKCIKLAEIEKELGFRSCFSFVPERYTIPDDLRSYLLSNGFEIAVHGLKHDGKLYSSKKEFERRAILINHYIKDWGASGFYSPVMQHNLKWLHKLEMKYDASTFDIDPFEPQPEGVRTIYPFWVEKKESNSGYIEIPYTLPQDITLFIILKEKNISIWSKKLQWLKDNKGLVFIKTHPDYMFFGKGNKHIDEYPVEYYTNFLQHIKEKYNNEYWHALPKEVSVFSRKILNIKDK